MLFTKNAKGGLEQWRAYSDGALVCFEHGKVGGKQVRHQYIAEATNVGRANQRDPTAQAKFEARAAWQKKLDSGYFTSVKDAAASEVLLPMLAQKFNAKHLRFPVSGQRKLNGLRCLAIVGKDTVTLLSRGGKEWDVPHLAAAVKQLGQPGDIFDGEIYIHGVSLQQLNSLVKNTERPERLGLQYHLYDMPKFAGNGLLPWEQRWAHLAQRYAEYYQPLASADGQEGLDLCVRLVETRLLHDDAGITAFERESILGGYEGLILRLHGEAYGFNQRPKALMKWKQFHDEEFEVVDMRSRVYDVNGSRDTICDVCVCRNNTTEATFEVVPRGSVPQKAEYWKNKDSYIGRRLIVRYLERSDSGIPQGNPVGLAFRLDEDLPQADDGGIWA